MTSVSSVTSYQQTASNASQEEDLSGVNLNDFLALLITELQNQDPLNPMENSEILQQIGQIREIGATNQLTETLQSVAEGQSLATASSLIGKQVSALSSDGNEVQGVVERVSIELQEGDDTERVLKVHIGEQSIDLDNIRGIVGGDQ